MSLFGGDDLSVRQLALQQWRSRLVVAAAAAPTHRHPRPHHPYRPQGLRRPPSPAPTPTTGAGPAATRSWKMGFSPNPPRLTVAAVLQGIDLWSQRAEYAIIHEELPWKDLLAGLTPEAILIRDKIELVQYLRGKGLELIFIGELNDGLARENDAPQLRALGRSITEPAIQRLYQDYILAVDLMLKPRVLGLIAESNLIRMAAPSLYPAIRQTANNTAAALRAAGSSTSLMASVQVETAWGKLSGSGSFAGIETDFADFPFVQTLGLSSYPYFGWNSPDEIPLDYYQRLLTGRTLPAMVVEGGWASNSAARVVSSEEKQSRYIARHAELLDQIAAKAWLQLQFADIDLAALNGAIPANLPLFGSIGLTDSNFNPKPALAQWDLLHRRQLLA